MTSVRVNLNKAEDSGLPGCGVDRAVEQTSCELDGDGFEPIAICGFSIKFPQDATSPEALWKMIQEKRCASTSFPADRINPDGFNTKKKRLNTLLLKGGHFIEEDLSAFDADFFSISPAEATAMDPMQRWLLEASFRALENAGIPMESISGSQTGVYTGSFNMDYMLQLNRDPENPPKYAAVGFGLSMLANRISWFFNLHGPSIGVDSACSSTAMALDIGCQALHNRSCNMALIAGCNLATSPESYVWMSNINFLSPDSRCHSFDHRANGYARGEGIAVMVIKRLSDAIRDGNTIRAVIRATGSNEDGRTPGITQPSSVAQMRLIRHTYKKAGLSMKHTRYFEAHGTGTPVGDPIEAQAIGTAFLDDRSDEDPIYVGALKSNIGHLEGVSGLAAVIKTVLVLEKGIIPPNSNFQKLNPKIDSKFLKLKFPSISYLWPTAGLRRASINSFGYGGANSHVVLDDAYNYLRLRRLPGKHCTVAIPGTEFTASIRPPPSGAANGELVREDDEHCSLLVFSAGDRRGIERIATSLQDYFSSIPHGMVTSPSFMGDLAYTLDSHRSQLPWRSYAVLSPSKLRYNFAHSLSSPVRANRKTPRIGFVFTGQGAQWFAMGRELVRYSSFSLSLTHAAKYLKGIGCQWSVIDELSKSRDKSLVDSPEYSQTLCTVLQVALVDLVRDFGLRPSSVVGHSSGEIAAAYAAGYISCESAWKIAYFRGKCSAELCTISASKVQGSMISLSIPEERALKLINSMKKGTSFGVSIACVNSPGNVTISGEEDLIDELKANVEAQGIFARKLRVHLAYHSRQMQDIADRYIKSIGTIGGLSRTMSQVPMVSSVTGERIEPQQLTDPAYWAQNMVSPVKFLQALLTMCAQPTTSLVKKIDGSHRSQPMVDHLIEIGPHAALQGPIREILQVCPRGNDIGHGSLLRRESSATKTMLEAMGELYSIGYPLNFRAINEPIGTAHPLSLLVNLPEYSFDHSQHYWHESRLSRNYRFRSHAPSDLLGVRSRDWNPREARWRHVLRLADLTWIEQHAVNGTVLYPGSGMLVMAIEAAKQLTLDTMDPGDRIGGYMLRDVRLEGPMDFTVNNVQIEVQTTLKYIQSPSQQSPLYEFSINTFSMGDWLPNCRGLISIEFSRRSVDWEWKETIAQRQDAATTLLNLTSQCLASVDSQHMYGFLQRHGYDYGPAFQAARQQRCDESSRAATAEIHLFDSMDSDHVVHPVSLDAILHLSFTALTRGGSSPMPTSIPSRIGHIWISNTGLSWPEKSVVDTVTSITRTSNRGFMCCGLAFDTGSSRETRVWYEGLKLTNVSASPKQFTLPNPKQYYMNIDSKVDLSKLGSEETRRLLNELHPPHPSLSAFFKEIEQLIHIAIKDLIDSVKAKEIDTQELWKRKYYEWARFHLETNTKSEDLPSYEFNELCQRLKRSSQVGKLYVEVASRLPSLFRDQGNALDVLLQSGLLKDYYEELASYRCAVQAASYIDLLAHQVPGMNILEVGGGTASATRSLIKALRTQVDNTHSLRCGRYDFTDISSAFLESARAEFSSYSQMTFGTLDIAKDLSEQGFQDGFYDVIVADNVLHIAPDLSQVLRNARRALNPGGKLLIHELLKPSGWTAGFVFGLFPGWWQGGADRRLSPNVTAETWDNLLKQNGFSGTDLVFKDYEEDASHHLGWLFATAVEDLPYPATLAPRQQLHTTIILNQNSDLQLSLARKLASSVHDSYGLYPPLLDLQAAALRKCADDVSNDFIVMLIDHGRPFLQSLDSSSWDHLQSTVRNSRHILWISTASGGDEDPAYGMLDGFARTLRSEYYELHLVTLALETHRTSAEKSTAILQVLSEMAVRLTQQPYEQEYIQMGGRLHTRRLVEACSLKSEVDDALTSSKVISILAGGDVPFTISCGSSAQDASYRYVQADALSAETLGSDEVDIITKAVTLKHHEGSLDIASHVSGIVLRAGTEVALTPGDHVITAAGVVPFQSHARVPSKCVVKIAPSMEFSDACWIIPPTLTALYALIEIGQVESNYSILINNANNTIGEACLQLLNKYEVDLVWVTASNEDEYDLFTSTYEIVPERVFPKTWVSGQPMLLSHLRQRFDIIVSIGDDSSSPQLVQYVKPRGRYVALHSDMRKSSEAQHIYYPVAADVSISVVYLSELYRNQELFSSPLLENAASFPYEPWLKTAKQRAFTFSASELDSALLHSQTVDTIEPTVITLDESSEIDVTINTQPTYDLDRNTTYLIAGGLGGLGRAMAKWLVGRGARHLILLSRSGPKAAEAHAFLGDLEERGINVQTPRCDVADARVLKDSLARCRETMPPIKGCIQSSVVLTELIFQNMEFEDWRAAIDPKVKGSWNLHAELPKDLDFFIMISSMMGILGSGSLGAYNAGNTYQDALARYRVSKGLRGISIDLGAMLDGGHLVENTYHLGRMERTNKFEFTYVKELCALIDVYCNPDSSSSRDVVRCQSIVGIRAPAHWKHLEEVPSTMEQPFWGHLHHVPPLKGEDRSTELGNDGSNRRDKTLNLAKRVASAGTPAEAAEIITEALGQRVAVLLGIPEDRLDGQKPMHSYGLDSLSALDLRNWVGKVFDVDMPIFEILGGATFMSAGSSIAQKLGIRSGQPNELHTDQTRDVKTLRREKGT